MKCIVCDEEITTVDTLIKLFWAPLGCNTSFVYKFVCSRKCWLKALDYGLKDPEGLIKKISEAFQ